MKTQLLFITSLLLSIATVSATEQRDPNPKGKHSNIIKHYRYAQPIVFMERGIEFMVFPDGSFDFDVLYNTNYYDSNTRRNTINTGYATKGLRVQYTSNTYRKPMIAKDRFGYITRIGNTPIYYNRMGDVTQIGSIDIDYKRRGQIVSKIGGLHVSYNHWGQIVHTSGYINRLNINVCNDVSPKDGSFYDKHYDANYFHYTKHGKLKKLKKKNH